MTMTMAGRRMACGLALGMLALSGAPHTAWAQSAEQTPSASLKTEYVVLVITDGLRWQEVFRGAERALIGKAGNVGDTTAILRDYWRDTPEARRAALLPVMWGTMAREGQIFGDSIGGSRARTQNTLKFSYPGYSETFTGHVDRRIDSNGYPPNPNITVFEWLNRDPAFAGRVSAFATWNAFRRIINAERSGVPVYDGWDRAVPAGNDARRVQLRDLYASTTRLWADNAVDALMHQSMLTALDERMPRVLFIGYGETDEWAHAGEYDLYLQAARQVDRYLSQLWTRFQSDPRTRGKVTMLVSTDHGRGVGRAWSDHGEEVIGAEYIWSAVIGPDTPARGVRIGTTTEQAQMASTIAALLGRNWRGAEPRAAMPLPIFGVTR
ncbi:MAG TPA: AP protein [Gemmatimonas aurantiaca]|nr:AP protein [Gemmatimonas aurantiaca]